ncbi:MAG: tetratricopeptide repeat protein [Bacteroidetes bacterium]|nr:tetratricopeptide repeat protein [Bacteroidota bacterium]
MSKKNQQKNNTVQTKSSEKYFWLLPAGILVLTIIAYFPLRGSDFVNWDDPTFVLGNVDITSLSLHNVGNMFSNFYMGNYCPLTIFSYAIDYSIAGLNPAVFHTSNIIIHLINTLLVFLFIYKLTGKQKWVAALTALLFGTHPMHVESVAWVAERRDVLYTLFFILSMYNYVQYIIKKESKYLIFSVICFILSILSKGQAVTLTAAIILIDIFFQRKFDKKVILEKVPYILLSLTFGYLTFIAQKTTLAVNALHISTLNSLFSGNYGLLMYIVKAFIPFKMSGFHPYPFLEGETLPLILYLSPFIIIAMIFFVFKIRKDLKILWGILFFGATIFPVLQFLPVGETIMAERYTYVPYIGLFFVSAQVICNALQYKFMQGIKNYLGYIAFAYLFFLFVSTWNRTKIWHNSVDFWSDVIVKYPDSKIAYNNRGYMYNEFGQYDQAIEDFNRGMQIDPKFFRLYLNRGLSYQRKKDYQNALADYTKSIELDTSEGQSFFNRGVIYTDMLNKYDLGILDFKRALIKNPDNVDGMVNMGVAYYKSEKYDLAMEQYNKAQKLKPDEGKIYYFRALVYEAQGNYAKAVMDANTAVSNGYGVDAAVISKWQELAKQ